MTRRDLFLAAPAAAVLRGASQSQLIVPVHHVMDSRARSTAAQRRYFAERIWPEAVRDFGRCGIVLKGAARPGEVRRSPSGQPIFVGLERHVINLVVTDRIPLEWDGGRALRGVTTLYRGHHLCMIALDHAHCHRIPFLAVNTCVHELLHVLLHDVFENRPKGWTGDAREFRIDIYATRLWLFNDGATIRTAALAYLDRLQPDRSLLD
jgi:hypothetical protein